MSCLLLLLLMLAIGLHTFMLAYTHHRPSGVCSRCHILQQNIL